MGELFDRYVVVDWSAAGRPKVGRDSIWIAIADGDRPPALQNPRTRAAAADVLRSSTARSDRVVRTLVAMDASFGYPRGSAAVFGIAGDPPWRAWWETLATAIVDDDSNANNRFRVAGDLNRRAGGTGPFWGRPHGAPHDHLAATKPDRFDVPEFRLVEEALRRRGLRPASCWQLLGAGSVGGQTLTLLPILHRLQAETDADVWPFTTGLVAPEIEAGGTVLAETWPTGFDVDPTGHRIRDAAQVDSVARELRRADRSGDLAAWFAPPVDATAKTVVEREEGWVLLPG